MIQVILRSIIDVPSTTDQLKKTIPTDELLCNYKAWKRSSIRLDIKAERDIIDLIDSYWRAGTAPSYDILWAKLNDQGNVAALAELKNALEQIPKVGADFEIVLNEIADEQAKAGFFSELTKAAQIVNNPGGLKVRGVMRKTIEDARRYLLSKTRPADSNIKMLMDTLPQSYGISNDISTADYIIPAVTQNGVPDGLFMRGTVCPLAAQQQTGKTVVLLHGIIRPALEGGAVLGRFLVPKPPRILYFQTDFGSGEFYNRFMRPFGWTTPGVDRLRFIHTKNLDTFTPQSLLQYLSQYAQDYDLIIIDTVTTLFPLLVWGKGAQVDSMDFFNGLSRIAIEKRVCIVPTIHTRKRLESRTDIMPSEIDSDSVLGPALKPCESCIGLWPCYWSIDMMTGKQNKKGEEITQTRYYPIYGRGCLRSLKNVPLLDGYDNVSEFQVINDVKPKRIEWLPYTNFIKPADESTLKNMGVCNALTVFFNSFHGDKITISELAQQTGLSLSAIYKECCYRGFLKDTSYMLLGGTMNIVHRPNEGDGMYVHPVDGITETPPVLNDQTSVSPNNFDTEDEMDSSSAISYLQQLRTGNV